MKIIGVIPEKSAMEARRSNNYLFDLFDNLFDEKFFIPGKTRREWQPSVDIYEKDGNYVVKADLPGIEEKDMSVEIKDNILTISGRKEEEKETGDGDFYRVERSSGSFTRSLMLPDGVPADQVQAAYNKGVLTVTVPKPKQAQTKKIEVKAS
jgi:HSP20 family protein